MFEQFRGNVRKYLEGYDLRSKYEEQLPFEQGFDTTYGRVNQILEEYFQLEYTLEYTNRAMHWIEGAYVELQGRIYDSLDSAFKNQERLVGIQEIQSIQALAYRGKRANSKYQSHLHVSIYTLQRNGDGSAYLPAGASSWRTTQIARPTYNETHIFARQPKR